MSTDPSYKEVKTTCQEKPRCVDGRPQDTSENPLEKGSQMLGATLHPLIVSAIAGNEPFDKMYVSTNTANLKRAGFGIAVHTDTHVPCGCGFCANLGSILQKVSDKKEKILEALGRIHEDNRDVLNDYLTNLGIDPQSFEELIRAGADKITSYKQLKIEGQELLNTMRTDQQAPCLLLDGEHEEQRAYVNLKPNSTFDTDSMAERGKQAFNLDLWAAVEQCQVLGVGAGEAVAQSLILYVATEMVLVEDAGKEALPLYVHG